MAEPQQPANSDAELLGLMKQMKIAGKSDEEIAKFIQTYDDIDHPVRAILGGSAAGVLEGLVNLVKVPFYDIPKSVIEDAVSMIQGGELTNSKEFLQGIHDLPQQWQEAGARERSEMVASFLTQTGVTAGVAKKIPASSKAIARTVGRGMTSVGEREWPIRFIGSAIGKQILPGPIGTVAGTALPEMLKRGGSALLKFGGATEASTRLPSGARTLDFGDMSKPSTIKAESRPPAKIPASGVPLVGTPAEASGRVGKIMANEERLAAIERERAGMVPGKTSVTDSMSAQTPEGGRTSLTRKFTPGEESAASPVPEEFRADYEGMIKTLGGGETSKAAADRWLEHQMATKAPQAPPKGVVPVRTTPTGPTPTPRVMQAPGEIDGASSLDVLQDGIHGENPPSVPNGASAPGITASPVAGPPRPPIQVSGPAPDATPPPTPRNLQMGSQASPEEMMRDIKPRVMGGGVRIAGPRPIQLVSSAEKLVGEAKAVFDQYMKENPKANPTEVEASIRKLTGQ